MPYYASNISEPIIVRFLKILLKTEPVTVNHLDRQQVDTIKTSEKDRQDTFQNILYSNSEFKKKILGFYNT